MISSSLFALALLFQVPTLATAATTVTLGSVSQFSGPDELGLHFRPSSVNYAVNFSNNDPDLAVNGVTLLHDRQAIPGFSSVGPNNVTPWQNKPEYGATASDNNLEQAVNDIRWANNGAGQTLQANFDVSPGQDYRLQLLISGNHNENRRWDITVEGMQAVDEITSLGVSPGQSYDVGRSTLYTYDFTAGDPQLNVVMGNLFGANDGGDRNAIWQVALLSEAGAIEVAGNDTIGNEDIPGNQNVSGMPGVLDPLPNSPLVFEIDAIAETADTLTATSGMLDVSDPDTQFVFEVINGTPQSGQTFQILNADDFIGTVGDISAPDNFDLSNLFIDGTVSVVSLVPEPSGLSIAAFVGLFGLAAGWLIRRRR